MGTAPTGYQAPKTNWAAGNVPAASDFNRIEGNIYAVEEGNRTIDPAQAPNGVNGTLRQFLDWFANRIKAITGKANWYDAPSKTLEDLNTHINAAAPHSGHALASDLTAHANNITHIPYAVASGSANAYTATINGITSYTEGLAVAIKINVTNTDPSTLNINGLGAKSIKKPNGNDVAAGNLKAGSIYTLRYNGTNFILQGSDSAGNATPADVLAGKTFSNDYGPDQIGTMPDNGAVVITPSTVNYPIPAGYHNGSGYVVGDANLIPENIKKDITIFGVTGNKLKYGIGDRIDLRALNMIYQNEFSTYSISKRSSYTPIEVVGNYYYEVCLDGSSAFIRKTDINTKQLISEITFNSGDTSYSPTFATLDEKNETLWFSNSGNAKRLWYITAPLDTASYITMPLEIEAIAVTDNYVFALGNDYKTIYKIDKAAKSIIASYTHPTSLMAVGFAGLENYLYFVSGTTLYAYDENFTQIYSYNVGKNFYFPLCPWTTTKIFALISPTGSQICDLILVDLASGSYTTKITGWGDYVNLSGKLFHKICDGIYWCCRGNVGSALYYSDPNSIGNYQSISGLPDVVSISRTKDGYVWLGGTKATRVLYKPVITA